MNSQLGGTSTIELEPNYRCVNASWKESDLWVLLIPMDSAYVP